MGKKLTRLLRRSPRRPPRNDIAGMGLLAMTVLFCQGLPAIEVPLEGFGKGTSVAYVNMHRVFEAFPETEKARIELNQMIAQKKEDISAKKEEIAALRAEIDFLKKQMGAVTPGSAPKTPPQKLETPKEPGAATSLTLPDGSPLKFLFSPPEKSTSAFEDPNKINYSTFTKASPEILPGIPSPGPSLMEKEAILSRKQSELEAYIGAAEAEITQMEEGKTMTLMARIYKALEDMANKQGYSVVMDKDHVLYGDPVIDITDQLIQRLSSSKRAE